MPSHCGGDVVAKDILENLTGDEDFTLPDFNINDDDYKLPEFDEDIFKDMPPLTNADLTTQQVGGTGTFDVLMTSVRAHLKDEYEQNRLNGDQYVKAYIEISNQALGNAVQFLLGRDQAYWAGIAAKLQAQAAQIGLVKARVELAAAKMQLYAVKYQALTAKAEYGLTTMKIATEDMTYCQLKYTVDNILPAQLTLLREQTEVQRAQTLNNRTDGALITGAVGKQKDLYTQQITSYQRDSEAKAAKMFVDAWITQKTIDEGLTAPTGFTNTSVDQVLTVLKRNNNLIP